MPRSPLALVACVAVALVGCGDDGDGGESEGQSGARAAYIRSADAFCAESNRRLAPLQARAREAGAGATTREAAIRAAAPVLEEANRARSRLLVQFRAIEPPAEDRRTIRTLLEAYDEENAVFESYAAAARRGDFEAFSARQAELQRLVARVHELAADYGFESCGGGAQ